MRDYVYIIAGKSLSAGVQMVMLILLAQRLPPQSLAILLAVYSVASIVAALGDLGLGTLAMRERVYGDVDKADQAIRAADMLSIAASAIGCVAIGAASLAHPPLLVGLPLMVWAPIERATENRNLLSIAEHKVARVGLLNGARRVLGLVLFLSLALVLPAGWAFSSALAVAALASLVVAMSWTPLSNLRRQFPFLPLLREAVPFTLTSVSGQMRNLDVPIIASIIGGAPAAAYGLGARLASPALLVFSSVSNLILVRARAMTWCRFLTLIVFTLAFSTVAAALLVSTGEITGQILSTFISWNTFDTSRVIVLVAASYLFAGVGIVFGSVCVAFDMQRKLVRVNIVTAVTSLTLVILCTVFFESAALAASASLSCYSLQAVTLAAMAIKEHPQRHRSSNG